MGTKEWIGIGLAAIFLAALVLSFFGYIVEVRERAKGMGKQERKAEKAYRRVLRGLKAAGSSEEVRELARRVERAHLGASGAGAAGGGLPESAVEREAARLRLETLMKDPPAHLPEWLREELGRVLRAWPARDGQEPAGKEPEEC